jgi:hypothetical protein
MLRALLVVRRSVVGWRACLPYGLGQNRKILHKPPGSQPP